MTKPSDKKRPEKPQKAEAAKLRDARLKEALRANLHRRKGQTRARADADVLKTED